MFDDALKEILGRLERVTQSGLLHAYGLIGGFACAVHGVPRSTEDIDFVVIPKTNDFHKIADALGADFHVGGVDDPLRGVFHVAVSGHGAPIPVQLIVLPGRWNDAITRGLRTFAVLGSQVPVVSWQTLILLKLYGGAPQDALDVEAILQVQRPSADALSELSAFAQSFGVAERLEELRKKQTD